ncbi:4'-phosphopantetheinyl transferase [Chitinibacter sp. ZOR0017]|uniref:4'-phosphopantetheinyl transferase family protein n=1 Tax=Chitinibacter sp. ZOR0017 TaxID=1339254 RepID=UPI0006913F7E|nr:4'-phosphopantetheinyl transferase superfamily protein [Chitinibacter sp. ZOR0017]
MNTQTAKMKKEYELNDIVHSTRKISVTLPNLVFYYCNYKTDNYNDISLRNYVDSLTYNQLRSSSTKRKIEFLAGRLLAKKALSDFGENVCLISIKKNHLPAWPEKYIGSISHSNGAAISIVARKSEYQGIGIDIESYMEDATTKEIEKKILTTDDFIFFKKTPLDKTIITLIFSAKESLFKALYPEAGHYFSFKAAKIELINFQKGLISLKLLTTLSPTLQKGSCFNGFFKLDTDHVYTCILNPKQKN